MGHTITVRPKTLCGCSLQSSLCVNESIWGCVLGRGKEMKFKMKVISHCAMKYLQGSNLALPREAILSLLEDVCVCSCSIMSDTV